MSEVSKSEVSKSEVSKLKHSCGEIRSKKNIENDRIKLYMKLAKEKLLLEIKINRLTKFIAENKHNLNELDGGSYLQDQLASMNTYKTLLGTRMNVILGKF